MISWYFGLPDIIIFPQTNIYKFKEEKVTCKVNQALTFIEFNIQHITWATWSESNIVKYIEMTKTWIEGNKLDKGISHVGKQANTLRLYIVYSQLI